MSSANTTRLADYRYNRKNTALAEVEYLFDHPDNWSILKSVQMEVKILDLNGQFTCKYATYSRKDLADRAYVLGWGENGPELLFIDIVRLPHDDPRCRWSKSKNVRLSQLTLEELTKFTKSVVNYTPLGFKNSGKPIAVYPKELSTVKFDFIHF